MERIVTSITKTGNLKIIAFILAAMILSSCKKNEAPFCRLTHPHDKEVYNIGDEVIIEAQATDEDGSIVRVEFYVNDVLTGSSNNAPFSVKWNIPDDAAGSINIKARAVDNDGDDSSNEIEIIINEIPQLTIVKPTNNQIFSKGDTILILADADDSDGNITEAELILDSTIIISDFDISLGYAWITDNIAYGDHTIQVGISDNDEYKVSAQLHIYINIPPVCTITEPASHSILENGSEVVISLEASDTDGTVVETGFYIDDMLVSVDNTAPYSYTWVTQLTSSGTHIIKAYAKDNVGDIAWLEIPVVFDNSPYCFITSPAPNALVKKGSILPIMVEAFDNNGTVSRVDFYIDDVLGGSDNSSPFSFQWNTADFSYGNHMVKAVSVDNEGDTASSVIPVSINYPPECAITSPANNSFINKGDMVSVLVSALDREANISKVEIFIDDELAATDFESPFVFIWNTGSVASGDHTLKAIAYDSMDDQCQSLATVRLEEYLYLAGKWEGEYTGYDPNMKKNVTIRRKLSVNGNFTYADTIWGKPDNMTEFIIYQCEKGSWEVIDEGSTVAWTPIEAKRIDIGEGGKLVVWEREPYVDPILLNSAKDEWSFRDVELEPDVDYYMKKQ